MISKIIKGANAGSLLDYMYALRDSEGRDREEVVDLGGTVAGASTSEMKQQLSQLASLRPTLRNNVAHLILHWTNEDCPPIADQMRMAQLHAEALGFSPWRAVSHGNHIHIAASRVNSDGSVVADSNDYKRGEQSRAALEQKFGLMRTAPSHLRDGARLESHERTASLAEMVLGANGIGSIRLQLQSAINAGLSRGNTLTGFVSQLHAENISVRLHGREDDGPVSGVSFFLDGVAMSGSSLGRPVAAEVILNAARISFPQSRAHLHCDSQASHVTPSQVQQIP